MKSVKNPSKLNLSCLATGFYPKDVKMSLRKFNTEIPDHLITSSAVRPNDDGTYQLRKSVEISGDDPADYDCYVSHSSLTEPVMKKWEDPGGVNVTPNMTFVWSIGLVFLVLLLFLVVCVLKKKGTICE
ncbi:class II histocompatibility antigen, B-L beta chain-like [Astyanax mexicanus]|uniref:class II histocompatibility antigen, B-L beta chain-like n=1 Tax=Astyanax mexicanus TaxID=7994 RepID=UPI0020CAE69D|nr:class II histocompatibility antigen, B-L beta chain-like [Astyanax mexicanus]